MLKRSDVFADMQAMQKTGTGDWKFFAIALALAFVIVGGGFVAWTQMDNPDITSATISSVAPTINAELGATFSSSKAEAK